MSRRLTVVAEVFSAEEIALTAGVSGREVRRLVAEGSIRSLDGRFVSQPEAVRAVRLLRGEAVEGPRDLFRPPAAARRSPGRALLASSGLHAAFLVILTILSTL